MRARERNLAARTVILISLLASSCASPPVPSAPSADDTSTAVLWESPLPLLARFLYSPPGAQVDASVYPPGRKFVVSHEARILGALPGEAAIGRFAGWTHAGALMGSEDVHFTPRPEANGLFLEVVTIDVGWGDAHLLSLPHGDFVLIDCGSSRHIGDLAASLDTRVGRGGRILALVLTHPHEDHAGGALGDSDNPVDGVLEAYDVGSLLLPECTPEDFPLLASIVEDARDRGIPVYHLRTGDDDMDSPEALGWDPLVRVEVMHSGLPHVGAEENDMSLVLRISLGEIDFLMTGDAERAAEERILARAAGTAGLASEVLKLSHHGSSDANSPAFLQAVSPRVALLSIDPAEVAWSLPHDQVLRDLEVLMVDLVRTDDVLGDGSGTEGHASVLTDGSSFELRRIPAL